jgi:hypothetical protein
MLELFNFAGIFYCGAAWGAVGTEFCITGKKWLCVSLYTL